LVLGIVCPAIGGLPIIDWIVSGLAQKRLADLGTGNISVSAAFYHGGVAIGLLAVLSEALKGIGVVLLARSLFPTQPAWEIVALIALVAGRYGMARGAGTTNVVWGYVAHDWVLALTVFILSGGLFALSRRRQQARLWVLVLIPIVEAGRRPNNPGAIAASVVLSVVIAWIYAQVPDDLALSSQAPDSSSRKMFRFLRGQDVIWSLDAKPDPKTMGQKAATLAELKQAGYPVPAGWVLPGTTPGRSLVEHLDSQSEDPWQTAWIVRSSALDEDMGDASAAGQYQSIADVTTPQDLEQAVAQCRAAYSETGAAQYRRDRGLNDQTSLALLVQQQVSGQYAGVAFSRDPIDQGDDVVVEALAGGAAQVVSGQVTPEQYRLTVNDAELGQLSPAAVSHISDNVPPPQSAHATVPLALVQQVANLARHLELRSHGIPQDIEWCFDGKRLWLLQARPITTLTPIWTRKIAAEVIPGVIRPLTWSINRPLTCGVWGKLFTLVLGDRAAGLDFTETATLHYSQAYFNATLLGQIFRRMGLPPESLEFLTFGAKFSKPPLLSTLKNVPGLLRLLKREWQLVRDFERDNAERLAPTLEQLRQQKLENLDAPDLLTRAETILDQLEAATYYSILAPLSFSLRRSLLKVPDTALDQSQLPEVASIQAVKALALETRQRAPHLFPPEAAAPSSSELLDKLSRDDEGQHVLSELDHIVERYGYLSEVGTDIAVPTWREDPQPVYDLFTQFCLSPPKQTTDSGNGGENANTLPQSGWRVRQVQRRQTLKGRVATVYLTLLAELRWSLVTLESRALQHQRLTQPGDIFFLTYDELHRWFKRLDQAPAEEIQALVAERRSQFEQHQGQTAPFIVYGNDPPPELGANRSPARPPESGVWQGIGASVGKVRGTVKVLTTLQSGTEIPPNTIVVVPYTDAGWAPILARAAGLVAEVGGRLSHGAIVAREYGIPAVMNVAQATQQFQDGEMICIDGRAGTVERVESGG